MHHTSLDEGFWRSAAEALASGDALQDVEPSLLDFSRLLRHIHESANRDAPVRLALPTLGGSEGERVLALVLAALVARGGRRVLLVDLDFVDATWCRLLAAEELEGVADHVAYGVAPARLVRRTSWENLALLPAGSPALHPAAILRSDKLRSCLELASPGYDLVCLGLAFDYSLDRDTRVLDEVDAAVLIGPAGDEIAFERAIPRLVPRVPVLATIDVPAPGRWRPALGAALPALLSEERAPLGARATAGLPPPAATEDAGSDEDEHPADVPFAAAEHPADPPLAATEPPADLPFAGGEAPAEPLRATGERARDLPLFAGAPGFPAGPADTELAADLAFLSGLEPVGAGPEEAAGAGRDRPGEGLAETSGSWERREGPRGGRAGEEEEAQLRRLTAPWTRPGPGGTGAEPVPAGDEAGGRLASTLAGVLLCLFLGAGAFWYWRDNQAVADGEFALVEAPGEAGPGGQVGARAQDPVAGAAAAAAAEGGPAVNDGAVAADGPAADERPLAGAPAAPEEAAASGDSAALANVPAPGPLPADSGGDARSRPAAPGLFQPPAAGPVLGYSAHVGSFQTWRAAQRAARQVARGGGPTFVAPVLLEGKGKWYRVFVGVAPAAGAAQAELARARRSGAAVEGAVRETPWALYLGTFETAEAAARTVAQLERGGISAYAVGSGPAHLYAGAFEAAADAELLNRELRDRGFEAALVRRRAVEAR